MALIRFRTRAPGLHHLGHRANNYPESRKRVQKILLALTTSDDPADIFAFFDGKIRLM